MTLAVAVVAVDAATAPVAGVRLARAQTPAHDHLEGEAKVLAEHGVDARVDGRVAVAEPE